MDNVIQRGMQADDAVGRFSFNLNVFGNLWEQIAKFRAARKLWAKMLREEYGVQDKKKLFLRGLFGGGGSGLTKDQPENNIMRGAFYALGAALSGAQTTALCSFDEAYTIPTPRAALLSLRTLEIIMDEVGLRDTVDPLAGSYFIETLTKQMEEKILEEMKEIQEIGGMVHAVATGFIQRKVARQAYEYEKGLQKGEYIKVGFNKYVDEVEDPTDVELHEHNEQWVEQQVSNLKELRRTRNNREVSRTLKELEQAGRRYDCFSILRPTSPFRLPATIERAWRAFLAQDGVDSLRAVEKCRQHPGKMWVVRGKRMMPLLPLSPPEQPWHSSQYQSLPAVYIQNASLEIAWTRVVLQEHTIAGSVLMPFLTEGYEGFDVNNPRDWFLAEHLVKNEGAPLPLVSQSPYPTTDGRAAGGR